MAKRTKKWEKDFEKRYSNAIKELQALENEYKEVKESDTNGYWYSMFPNESHVEFGECDGVYLSYVKENQYEAGNPEHITFTIKSELGSFNFDFTSFKQLKELRNDIIEEFDKMSREDSSVSIDPDDCEEEEGWEDNEEQEYTIQCSRTAVQTWTHTVMARSTCEAYRKAEEGEGHDENDDFDDYGDIDYELI